MADQEEEGQNQFGEVVSEVTVKALREFSSGSFHEDGKPQEGSRPGSAAKQASGAGSPAGSVKGSRPGSARPGSAAKQASGAGSPAGSVKGSRPGSAKPGSRPGSAAGGSRPQSVSGVKSPSGSRPTSAAGVKSPVGSRPTSAAGVKSPVGSRPTSVAGVKSPSGSVRGSNQGSPVPEAQTTPKQGSRPASGEQGSRPQSAQRSRPQSAAKESRPASRGSRPPTAQAGQDEDGLVISGSRPGSARQEADPERPSSGRPTSGRPTSAAQNIERPTSGRPESADKRPGSGKAPSVNQDDRRPSPPAPEPTRDEADLGMNNMMMTSLGPPDGGDGGDSDEDDEMMGIEDEEEEDEDESDGEAEMVVLDPDHPLMQRFQRALKAQLEKQNEKVTLELRELLEAVKGKRGDREEIGVELYGIQQELAKHQMQLEKHHDNYSNIKQHRTQIEQQLSDIRGQYKDRQLGTNDEKRKGAALQGEVENLALRLFYMENAKEDVRSDIAVMKRAAEKAEMEVSKAEMEKQRQDLYVDRLVERVDKLREDIALFEAQITAQSEETKAAKNALMEAHMEIEAISLEKKQLFQQWNSSVIGMRRRDEAHAAMQEALNQQQQRILSLETEIEGYKKSISKEQEQNEKLTLILSKTDQDISTVKKMLAMCQAKHDALKNEYAAYTRMLHETEQALNRANTDKTLRSNEVNALRKQIEREYLEKVRLEDEIIEKLRGQLTMDKAAQYTDKLTKKLRLRTRDMDQQVAVVENDISKATLDVSHTKSRTERLKKVRDDLDEEIKRKNNIISKSDAEMTKRNAMIERKQGIIDQYNKKLELMITQAGGVELGPLEIQINSIQKSIEGENQEIVDLKQMWLRNQSELVQLSKEKDGQGTDVENLKKELTILSQKKLRIEAEISSQLCETNDIQRNVRNMENDMLKLNTLLHKERGTEVQLQQGNILKENDFIGSLREAELAAIEMQEQLEGMQEEKERLLNSLVEAERQIMLWEKKTQLAKETRAAVDGEVGQGEIRAMKAEIHRMQVRYTQLMKQQERMIQEMEKAVSRRDTIVTRGDAQSKMNKKVLTKGTFQRQMNELKKKIKTTIQDANTCDREIVELRHHQQELSSQLEDKQLSVQQLQSNTDTLDSDVDRLLENKQKNMSDLLTRQQRSKYYNQVKDGKYTRLCRTETSLDNELQKQVDRMQALMAIVDRLNQEYPHVQPGLRKVTLAFGSRGAATDGEY